MATKELVLEFSELQRVSVTCPYCQLEIMFDLSQKDGPLHCCDRRPPSTSDRLFTAIKSLEGIYTALDEIKARVHVRLPAA